VAATAVAKAAAVPGQRHNNRLVAAAEEAEAGLRRAVEAESAADPLRRSISNSCFERRQNYEHHDASRRRSYDGCPVDCRDDR
jgi:hypothetical protein